MNNLAEWIEEWSWGIEFFCGESKLPLNTIVFTHVDTYLGESDFYGLHKTPKFLTTEYMPLAGKSNL